MPQAISQIEHALAVVTREQTMVAVQVGKVTHTGTEPTLLGLSDIALVVGHLKCPKAATEVELLVIGQGLVTKDQHCVFIDALRDSCHRFYRQRAPQIETADLGCKRRAKLLK